MKSCPEQKEREERKSLKAAVPTRMMMAVTRTATRLMIWGADETGQDGVT